MMLGCETEAPASGECEDGKSDGGQEEEQSA